MSGRRLIPSLIRKRSIFRSAFPCTHEASRTIHVLVGRRAFEHAGAFQNEIVFSVQEDFSSRNTSLLWFHLHQKLLSTEACLERTFPEAREFYRLDSPSRSVVLEDALASSSVFISETKDPEDGKSPTKRKRAKRRRATSSSTQTNGIRKLETVRCEPIRPSSPLSDVCTVAEVNSEKDICQNGSTSDIRSDSVFISDDIYGSRVPSIETQMFSDDVQFFQRSANKSATQRVADISNASTSGLLSDRNHFSESDGQVVLATTGNGNQVTGRQDGVSSCKSGKDAGEVLSGRSKKGRKLKHLGDLDLSDACEVFEALLGSKQSGNMPKPDRDALVKVFKHFHEEGWALEQAAACCYISSVIFPTAVSRFRKFFLTQCTPDIRMHLLALGPSAPSDCFLFPLFSEFCRREFAVEIARYKALVETADLTKPHTWFPFARAIKRKIIYHSGPTNSGKTYNALQRFKEASNGVYCSPLRLLAMEVYDMVNSDGVYCSLSTGQEKKEVPFSNHLACTVEMVPTQKCWEVAVIDEIQMLKDEFRGWAWTRALLGLQAQEIHICGDPSARGLIRDICAVTGDELEEFFYERFQPLTLDRNSLGGKYSNVQQGDCIVSFSRKEIFGIKMAVEQATTNRCCVVYGALPPETRTHQAKLFNDPQSGYNVLVATDAVGMGLNLNIRRIVFYTLDKYDGEMLRKVPASQVKQIAGRAGRRGSIYPQGSVTTFYSKDVSYLVECLEEPFSESCTAGLFPTYEQIELFATQLPQATFAKLLDRFTETCQVDGSYFLCRNDNLKKVAAIIDKAKGLTMEDKLKFILAPVNTRDPKVMGALFNFALAYGKKLPVHLAMVTPSGSARNDLQLLDLEARHQVLSLYLWLSNHFPEEYFPQKEQSEQLAAEIALLLGESLSQEGIRIVSRERRTGASAKKKVKKS